MKSGLPSDRPNLQSVTLVAVSSVAMHLTIEALRSSVAHAQFGRTLLLSDRPPPAGEECLEWVQIPRLSSRWAYSRFMLRDLLQHIATSHALCIQWDGFVLDGTAWDPSFLDYDYVGAPWPHFNDGHNVGNGGFSLRSRRLLEACRTLPFGDYPMEDVLICREWRPQLERQGIRFAPESIARRFSFERMAPKGGEFGFHGAFNLVRQLSPVAAMRTFSSLEPGMLARNEKWELLRWALRHGRIRLALEMLRRLA